MGSFGALYYATVLEPAAVIIGKPLINIGTIANNMKLLALMNLALLMMCY